MSNMLMEDSVHIYNRTQFKASVEQLNRKCVKLGMNPIEYEIDDKEQRMECVNDFGEKYYVRYWIAHIWHEGEISIDGDWRLIATCDHFEGLMCKVHDQEELGDAYLNEPKCDHCGTNRNRKKTLIMKNAIGEIMQIGTTCVKDYFGIDPANVLAQSLFFEEGYDSIEGDQMPREPECFALDAFLANVSLMLRNYGWVSRGQAYEERLNNRLLEPTADRAFYNMVCKKHERKPIDDSDRRLGKEVAQWMESLGERENLNDYMLNLASIGKNQFVTKKSIGFAASAINAMRREIEQAQAHIGKNHVGKPGGKVVNLKVELVESFGYDTDWGYSFMHRFVSEYGDVLIWKTSKQIDPGHYVMRASIKAHDQFRGEPQTIVTRATLKEIE